ncbi:peptide chain release factor N(5)-glutamine methyltransferase [Rickettsiella grylli]|uniref:Release factor glutamine methyltransferase n=1 Tax=Rickettsiella grylli TaxID=59196 RepID=A8PLZ7_9COXI|nr:peptide chain release factor N(5)-glutamine methyltransferase [Rickettsiella grylli]EDP46096.1 protein-(glutamine-N5) methyltransferase, release factor-specific [Rickettsiella grylli]
MLFISYWRWAINELKRTSPTAYLDTELLFSEVLKLTRAQLHSQPLDRLITITQEKRIKHVIARRQKGEPIAYLLGRQEFWSFMLEVTPDVLIPRPETELLVEVLLENFSTEPRKIVDLGTGSAAISVALAWERPTWQLLATDCSMAALQVAKRNISRYHLQTIELRKGYWCEALNVGEKFDGILSNPPYLARNDPHLQSEPGLAYEPKNALISGEKGLDDLERIIIQSREYLHPGGILFLEHGAQQATLVEEFFLNYGYHEIKNYKDLAGHQRVSCGKWN